MEMFKKFFTSLFHAILPPRSDFALVKSLDAKTISKIDRAPEVEGMPWITALFPYRDNRIRAVVWELKYKGNPLPLHIIGELLYEEITALIADIVLFNQDAEFLLVPIPITDSSRRERGYNQSEYIAKAVLEHDAERILLYAPQWLGKIKETGKQSRSASKEERVQNLSGCFEADSRVSGKYVILIDDVVTTGTTLLEAQTTLLSAGARDVFAFTIAH